MTTDEKIQLIGQKIYILSNNLDKYRAELDSLKQQLEQLKAEKAAHEGKPYTVPVTEQPAVKQQPVIQTQEIKTAPQVQQQPVQPVKSVQPRKPVNIEEYIGGNVIAKVGIVVLVIGIAIGVKYAIDRDLINYLTRVVLGYLAGGILLGLAFFLKKRYEAFSAVLLSGGMATLYFTTFIAYSFYQLMGQVPAFGLMVVFTAFTVFAATIYNQQWIGIFGLVGAYAVPMLLDNHSGKVHIMFIYMTILNTGILILSFKKYWQWLTYTAYLLTWLIFAGWFFSRYDAELHGIMALSFSFVFFITFYLSFIAYKTIRKEKFNFKDIILVLLNSFIFFSIGYAIVSELPYGSEEAGKYLGLFTLCNALVHLGFAYSVFINKQVDRKLFFLIMALVLCFATIAVPIQLEGNWVTLFWIAEMFLLFWIGRVKNVRFYEWLSFIMVILALASLVDDWQVYRTGMFDDMLKYWKPVANITFLTSVLAILSLGGMIYIDRKYKLPGEERKRFGFYDAVDYILPSLLALVIYFAFSNEISNYFYSRVMVTAVKPAVDLGTSISTGDVYDYDLLLFKTTWQLNFTMLFVFALWHAMKKMWHNAVVTWVMFGIEVLAVIMFLTAGFYTLSQLRDRYLAPVDTVNYFTISAWYIYIRYICFIFLGLVVYNMYSRSKAHSEKILHAIFVPLMHLIVLVVLSSELTNIMMLTHPGDPYHFEEVSRKMGYTVLWGVYSFVLIAMGIVKKNKVLRIAAISLFGLTLIKLFAFDIIGLSTGYKVVAFTALGVLLLVVSFLYQKFKNLIFGDDEPR